MIIIIVNIIIIIIAIITIIIAIIVIIIIVTVISLALLSLLSSSPDTYKQSFDHTILLEEYQEVVLFTIGHITVSKLAIIFI